MLTRLSSLSVGFRRELGWLATTLAGSVALGVLVGHPGWLVALGLVLHAIWLLWRLEALVRWLQDGARPKRAPPTVGLGNRVVELVHREKRYSRKQKHRYRNALAQFTDLAAALPDATVVLDEQRQIRWANAAAGGLLKVHSERDRGRRIDNLVRAPDFLDAITADGDGGQDAEIELPSGSGRTLAVRVVPSGNRMSLLIARDVTQRVRVREMRKRFVDDVSHELRTPLTVIRGYLEMLREDERFVGSTREALEQVAAQSARMQDIVEHLLQLSRLEGEPLRVDEGETIAVAALLRTMVANIAAALPEARGISFSLGLDETLGLRGSESEIWSACNNLVVNAVKYGGDGEVRVTWERDPEGRALCRVADDGSGIEARHLPRLSERFYRVDRDRSRGSGGTGLGLAIVKHAAQRHGGQLLIESTPGVGSTFTIELPAERVVALPPASVATPPPVVEEPWRALDAGDRRDVTGDELSV